MSLFDVEIENAGIITVDYDIEEIPVGERKTVGELCPDCKEEVKDYVAVAIIKTPDDLLIVPPAYKSSKIEKKREPVQRPSDDHINSEEFYKIFESLKETAS